jgi:putative ABC transport system substrate-binding protein
MAGSESPVEAGLIASFAHPGGNVTGLTHSPGPGIVSKALQLLKEAAPNISRIAVLGASDGSSSSKWISDFSVAKRALNVTFLPHNVIGVGSTADFNAILSKIKEEHADAVFVFAEFENIKYRNEILNLLSENRLPSMFQGTDFVRDGGLLSYYADFQELRRQAAGYVDKILKGAKPADLPVEQPTKFALTINLKTAKELGLTMPQLLLAQADEVVE